MLLSNLPQETQRLQNSQKRIAVPTLVSCTNRLTNRPTMLFELISAKLNRSTFHFVKGLPS